MWRPMLVSLSLLFLSLVFLVLQAAGTAAETDVSGKWSGTVLYESGAAQNKQSYLYLVLQRDGALVTGTAGPVEENQFPIKKGRIQGNVLTFETDPSQNGQVMSFTLKVGPGKISGTVKAKLSDSDSATGRVTAERIGSK